MEIEARANPMDKYLRADRIPHIWCSGCGLGIVLNAFLHAIEELNIDLDKLAVVSGIGCTGRIAGYINTDSYHTTHGRAIPFATGLKLANPEMKVVVISGDGDLFAIGGNHFIHAARRNIDITVIGVNNYNYGMTGGQLGPTTPLGARTTTSPYGNIEHPFNLCHVAHAAGAVYVARWTVLHAIRLKNSIKEALNKRGFSFIEVIAACPTTYGRRNKMPDALDEMRFYREHSVIKHGIDPSQANIEMGKEIVVGKFVDIEKPTFNEAVEELKKKVKKK